MPELLDRIREEIRERLNASRDAVEKHHRLEGALAALESRDGRSPRDRQTTSARGGARIERRGGPPARQELAS